VSTTTVLAGSPLDDGLSAALGIAPARARSNHSIRWATTASVVVHLILLFALGFATLSSTDVNLVPTLDVRLEEDGKDLVHDGAPDVVATPPPSARMLEQQPSVVADSHSSDAPRQDGAETAPIPTPELPSQADVPDEILASASPLPELSTPMQEESSEFLVTSGPSAHIVPAQAADAPPVEEVAAVATSEREMLERQINKKMRVFEGTDLQQTTLSWQHEGKLYTALLERHPAVGNTDIEHVTVQITTDEKGKRLRTQMQMKRLAFSHFTQLVDHWDTEVQFHDDQIAGRVHSNSEILVGYDRKVAPRFLGKVTTAARGFAVANTVGLKRRDEMFTAGFESGVRRISLPARFLPATTGENSANAEVHKLADDTRIVFFSDGTYSLKRVGTHEEETTGRLAEGPTYFIGERRASLHVRGIIRGKVLVYSPERVIVEGSLIYAQNPRAVANAPDFLGLASDNVVEIARPKVTGPGDIEIDAAIYARDRFVVTDEYIPERATLFIYGNLTAGTLSATEPRYATKLEFDRRFETLRPPGFPMTNRYEIESWDGRWTVEDYDRVQ
jgi:hypothetical protein